METLKMERQKKLEKYKKKLEEITEEYGFNKMYPPPPFTSAS